MDGDLNDLAMRLADCLRSYQCRIVFAESCTSGLVSAALGQIPGISEFHCGSAVVYRLDTKTQWLGVPPELLIEPHPVSEAVARTMGLGVLSRTPEADWAGAITGHLGPNAPQGQDGLAYIAVARRDSRHAVGKIVTVVEHHLGDPLPRGMSAGDSMRNRRQVRAAELVLKTVHDAIHRDCR